LGWGPISLKIRVYFKPGTKKTPMEISYRLCFDGSGASESYLLEFDRRTFTETACIENVWDYPLPPDVETTKMRLELSFILQLRIA
jgi:hypothetical protein